LNYYPFNIGDYAAHTAHLEPMEDLAYRRLLDQYYMREEPLPADIQATAKLIRMRSMAADVESVLREYFILTDAGWTHSRCDREIEHMQDKQAKARASAKVSVSVRRANAERTLTKEQTDVERTLPEKSADVELPTPTPTPTPIPREIQNPPVRKRTVPPLPCPDGVNPQTWDDWQALRRKKSAPVTQTVVDGARAEAGKAGLTLQEFLVVWCTRGSQGMQAEWIKPADRPRPQVVASAEPAWRTEQRERTRAYAGHAFAGNTATTLEADDAVPIRLG